MFTAPFRRRLLALRAVTHILADKKPSQAVNPANRRPSDGLPSVTVADLLSEQAPVR